MYMYMYMYMSTRFYHCCLIHSLFFCVQLGDSVFSLLQWDLDCFRVEQHLFMQQNGFLKDLCNEINFLSIYAVIFCNLLPVFLLMN